MLELLKNALRWLLGRPLQPRVTSQHRFDQAYGVDTSGLLEGSELAAGHGNDPHNTAYFGVPPSRFIHAVELWQATLGKDAIDRYRLIDIGCGKGRAVLLASCMSFRDVAGIELNPALARTAEVNLERWKARPGTVTSASILCGDGPSLLPPLLAGPTLVYLYNPFRAPALRSLLTVIVQAPERTAPVDVLYLYPEFEEVFHEFPLFQRVWHQEVTILPEDENDGLSSHSDPCSLYRLAPASNGG